MTCELYPTNLRSQAVGSASTISRIFCAFAPFLKPLQKYYQPLPMLVIGVPILISAAFATQLPETFRKKLPETMKKAEKLADEDQADLHDTVVEAAKEEKHHSRTVEG